MDVSIKVRLMYRIIKRKKQTSKQTNKTNKQDKQANKQTNKTNKQDKHANKQTNKTNKQTNKQTKKRNKTNNQTNKNNLTYSADAKNNQKAEAGASTYWPSTTPNFRFWSKNCVSTKRTASVTSAKNITKRPGKNEIESQMW